MSKNIVVCCDGTGNQYGEKNTNVVKLFEALIKNNKQEQVVFYDPGLGTFSEKAFIFAPLRWLGRMLGGAFGIGLQKNVEDAYSFLMDVYEDEDDVFLFGFSRGAHTVRRLASMLDKCGLLQRGSRNMIPYASRMYLSKTAGKTPLAANPSKTIVQGFKDAYCRSCPVHFLGVWDTVSALSKLRPRPQLDGILNEGIHHAYHALAIDERRLKFPPNLWREENIDRARQTVEQVWFAGVHSDVGGGYYDKVGGRLANIPLAWMLTQAQQKGLHIHQSALQSLEIEPLAKQHESWSRWWRLLPYKRRQIPPKAKVHLSVQARMATEALPHNNRKPYNPENLVQVKDNVQWVGEP